MSQQKALTDWIEDSKPGYTCRVQVIRQIYDQLKKCHRERNFCGIPSPETVYIDDTGNITPIRCVETLLHPQHEQDLLRSQKKDIFEFGCLIYFIFTDGEHPFGSPEDKNRDIFARHDLYDLDSCDDESIRRLIASMIQQNADMRPTVFQLEDMHPIFWTDQRSEEYLNDFLAKFNNNAVGSSGSISTDDETFHLSLKQVYVRPDNDAIKNKSITERNKWKTPLITTSCWKILDYMKCGKEGRGLRDWLTVYPSVTSAVFLAELKRNETIIKKALVMTEQKGSLIINATRCTHGRLSSFEFYHGRLDDDYVQVFENDDSEFLKWWQRMRRLRKNPNVLSCLDYFIPQGKTSNTWFGATEPFQETLETWMEESKDFSLAETKDLLRQIVNGIEFIHSSGLIHGNLAENNVIIFIDDANKSSDDDSSASETKRKTTLTVKVAKLPWKTTAATLASVNRRNELQSCKNDVRALGAIIRNVLEKFKHLNAVLARHLVNCLTNEIDSAVPETAAILYHPFFWSEYAMAGFFACAHRFYASQHSVIGSDSLVHCASHYSQVEATFLEAKMNFSNVHRDILQAFANKFHSIEQELDSSEDDEMERRAGLLCSDFCKCFPQLAMLTWIKLQTYKKESDCGINHFYTQLDYDWPKFDDATKDLEGTVALRTRPTSGNNKFDYPLDESNMQEAAIIPHNRSREGTVYLGRFLDEYLAAFAKTKKYKNGTGHLLTHGNVNQIMWTALHLASVSDQFSDFTKQLLKEKANPNCKDDSGHTPLHVAAICNSFNIIRTLVKRGADVNMEDDSKETPLFKAVTFGATIEIAKFLLDKHADPKKRNSMEQNLLHKAVLSGSTETAKFALQFFGKFCDVNELDVNGVSPFALAVAAGHTEMIHLLIESGANTNAPFAKKMNNEVFTYPLHYAIVTLQSHPSFLTVIKTLLDSKASLEKKDYLGRTPLHYAAIIESQELRIQILSLMLEKIPENCKKNIVNACDNNGMSVLHVAVAFCSNDVVRELIKVKELDLNAKILNNGSTCLHYAALTDNEEAARCLLEKGAIVDETDTIEGETPLHFAAAVGAQRVAKLLIEKGANVNEKSKKGSSLLRTPLHLAAGHGQTAVARLLVDNRAKIDARDKLQLTPLHYAEHHHREEIVKLLEMKASKANKKQKPAPSSMSLKPKDCVEYRKLTFLGKRKNLLPLRGDEPLEFRTQYDDVLDNRLPQNIQHLMVQHHHRPMKIEVSLKWTVTLNHKTYIR